MSQKSKVAWNKGKKCPWAKNNPQTFKKGMTPWNKGKKYPQMIGNTNGFKKGQTPWNKEKHTGLIPRSAFKKGHISLRKGKKFPEKCNQGNPNWKGNKVSYSGLHYWVKRHKGKPQKCIKCGRKDNLEWANKDHKYRRVLKYYISLCVPCHRKFDKTKRVNRHKFL